MLTLDKRYLSLDETELETVMFDGDNENEAEDDVIGF